MCFDALEGAQLIQTLRPLCSPPTPPPFLQSVVLAQSAPKKNLVNQQFAYGSNRDAEADVSAYDHVSEWQPDSEKVRAKTPRPPTPRSKTPFPEAQDFVGRPTTPACANFFGLKKSKVVKKIEPPTGTVPIAASKFGFVDFDDQGYFNA